MVIIYYRDKTGEIVRSEYDAGLPLEKLIELQKNYNASADKTGRTAHIEQVPDDSLTAYLFRKTLQKKAAKKESIDYAIQALESAIDMVRDLDD